MRRYCWHQTEATYGPPPHPLSSRIGYVLPKRIQREGKKKKKENRILTDSQSLEPALQKKKGKVSYL
jgi:hypothetical protein